MTSWGSVAGGKWHVTVSNKPTFVHDEQSLCGITFRPLNVTWNEPPLTFESSICKRCQRHTVEES